MIITTITTKSFKFRLVFMLIYEFSNCLCLAYNNMIFVSTDLLVYTSDVNKTFFQDPDQDFLFFASKTKTFHASSNVSTH